MFFLVAFEQASLLGMPASAGIPEGIVSVKVNLNLLPLAAYDSFNEKNGTMTVIWHQSDVVGAVFRAFQRTPQHGNPYLVSRCAFYGGNNVTPRYTGDVDIYRIADEDRPAMWRYLKKTMVRRLDGLAPGQKQIVIRTLRHRFLVPPRSSRRIVDELREVPAEWVGSYFLPTGPIASGGKARIVPYRIELKDARGRAMEVRLGVSRLLLQQPVGSPSPLTQQLRRALQEGGALPDVAVGFDGGDPKPGSTRQMFPPPASVPRRKSPSQAFPRSSARLSRVVPRLNRSSDGTPIHD